MWTSLNNKNSRVTQLLVGGGGGGRGGWFSLFCKFTSCKYVRKISMCFKQGEGKRNHFEIGQSILFFLTRSVLSRK